MSNQPVSNKILAMDPEHLREIDGVVLDLDSYARHTAAPQAPEPLPQQPERPASEPPAPEAAAPAPVFAAEPQHVGWYEPATPEKIVYPVMAGAIPPQQGVQTFTAWAGSGSYLSSYLSSFSTSFLTSFMTSYLLGSGSWVVSYWWGSGSAASSAFQAGGFGLELI
ncbi:MAG: hypothetical protein Q3Y08_08110 [Butyricicoccus sp.]|nr:hypothetical protein [Butyricicoccus sp.]